MGGCYLPNATIGNYRVVDFLGAGGMGEVYRAVHVTLGRVVAIKVLTHAGRAAAAGERFLNEARIQAALHHPHIAELYEFLPVDGRPCIVMEYVDGQTVADRIRSEGPLPLPEALSTFRAVVEAIDYMHRQGIVHRDIKSNNVKVSAAGQVKLLDFGIAKAQTTPHLTVDGSFIGTLEYLAPEQMTGKEADTRSDIWALGVLLYEMVSGRVPFDATTVGDLFVRISKAAFERPSTLNRSVSPPVERVIARCLRKDPSDRYPSAQELLRDIERLCGTPERGRSTQSEGGGWGKIGARAARWGSVRGKGKRVAIVAAAALGVVIIAGSPLRSRTANRPPEHAGARPKLAEPAPEPPSSLDGKGNVELREYVINVTEGRAEVFQNNERKGTTPYPIRARLGERIELVLKQEGHEDRLVTFEAGQQREPSYKMVPME